MFLGGARYRLRQSQRYKEAYDALIRSLNIQPFENYNAYNDATYKVLTPTLHRIGRLLSDFDNINDKYYNLLRIASAEVTANKNTEIADLQRFAELALVILLGPYYGASITTHILGIDEGTVLDGWLSKQVVFAGGFLCGVCLYVARAVTTWARRDEESYNASRLKMAAAIKSCFRPLPAMLMIIAVLFAACLYVFSAGH